MHTITLQLMLVASMALAASEPNYSQELLLLPGKENSVNLPNSALSLLAANGSERLKKMKVECSPQFIANVKIAGVFSELCGLQSEMSGTMTDLASTVAGLRIAPVGATMNGSFIRFVFVDAANSEPDVSLVFSFRIPTVIPLIVNSSSLEILTGQELKVEQQVAEIPASYLINAKTNDFTVNVEPAGLVVTKFFKGSKLFLEFDTSALTKATAISLQLIDTVNGLRSPTVILQAIPVAVKLNKSAMTYTSQMAIMISIISFSSIMAIGILAIYSIYPKDQATEVANQDLETATDPHTSQIPSPNPPQCEQRVLTDSILIWNKVLLEKHKSHSLSTLETSRISGNQSPSSDRITYFGKFDMSDDAGQFGIDGSQGGPDDISVSVPDNFSVMTQPGYRRSAFLS
jgi:hypothetical protein